MITSNSSNNIVMTGAYEDITEILTYNNLYNEEK